MLGSFSLFLIFGFCAQISFSLFQNDAGGDASASSSSDSDSNNNEEAIAFVQSLFNRNSQPSYSNYNNGYNNYQYANQAQPIYGNARYTYGQVNRMVTIRNGQPLNYNSYSNNYWNCVNNYRGQYYYSYNYGHYVCDTRANRYGK